MTAAAQTLLVLVIMILFFITEWVPLAVTAMGGAITLGLLGIIPLKIVFGGLSNSTVVLFAGMFVISASLFYTGLTQKMGVTVVKLVGKDERNLMLGLMIIAVLLSSVTSNTGTTAVLMPVAMGICAAARIHPARLLMPLAFAAALGGMITLVGTPPNIIVSNVLKATGMRPFGFFEFALLGIPLSFAGIVYMLYIGRHLLPHRLYEPALGEDAGDDAPPFTPKMLISGSILLAVVVLMALDLKILPLEIVATMGALACVLTGCLTEKQAYQSIDWVTIFLFAGMMAVAEAMDRSGAARMIVNWLVDKMGTNWGPMLVTVALFVCTVTLTQFMPNTACTALLAPIGVTMARSMGVSPYAALMAIGVASSCAFATPVGTPPNTLVLGPGGYRFIDYVKVGTGLIFVCFIVSIIVIPLAWPFISR